MKLIRPSYEILTPITGDELKNIELAGRVCYKSEDKITNESAKKFVANLIQRGHEAMLEHSSLSVKFVCDRGVSHELVRHRMASFAQESTRFCNYSNEKFGNELTFIIPFYFYDLVESETSDEELVNYHTMRNLWESAMKSAEYAYMRLIDRGASPQEARSVLPNSLKTEVVTTANYREWRHFFKLRAVGTSGKPHPQMRELTVPLLIELSRKIPVIFDDLANSLYGLNI